MDNRILLLLWPLLAAGTVNADERIGPLDCLVEPHVVIEVSSPVPGVIGSIEVEKSDLVEAGQPLASLESAVWESAVREARSRAEASAAIESAKANLAFAGRNQQRIEELFAKGVVSKHHMDEAQTELELARADLKRANEDKRTAIHELQRAREQLRQRTIRSPIGGVVVARLKSPGEFVEVSPILELAQLDPLKIRVIAPSSMFGAIRMGMRAEVTVESSVKPYDAEVSLVDRIVDGASGSFGVELQLPNPNYDVPVGLRCQVSLAPAPQVVDETQQQPVTQVADETEQPAVQSGSKDPQPVALVAGLDNSGQHDETAATSCLRMGPLSTPELTEKMAATLTGLSLSFSQQRRADAVPNGYLLLSPRQPTLEDAKALTENLKRNGIDDVAALWKGPYSNRVSFGYFHDQAIAIKRLQVLHKRGVEAAVVPRLRKRTSVWFELPDEGRVLEDAAVATAIRAVQPQITISNTACSGDEGNSDRNVQPALHASRDASLGD